MSSDLQVRYRVQKLLDVHGAPPTTICLDWATQLQALESRQDNQRQEDPNVPDAPSETTELTWSDITIGAQGELGVLLETTGRFCTSDLVEQTLRWSGATANESTEESFARLSQALLPQTSNADSPKVADHSWASGALNASPTSPQNDSSPLRSKRTKQRNQRDRSTHPSAIKYGAIATIGFLGIGLVAWAFSGRGEGPVRPELAAKSNPAPTDLDAKDKIQGNAPAQVAEVTSLTDLESAWSTAEDAELENTANPSSVLQGSLESRDLLSMGLDNRPTKNPTTDTNASDDAGPSEGLSILNGSSDKEEPATADVAAPPSMDPAASNVDVMAELQAVATEAEKSPREVEMSLDDEAGTSNREPLLITTFPMLQVQKLKELARIRAREPAWKLRLETSDGFTITPNQPQTVGVRESVKWIITPEDAEDDTARVYVVAQVMDSKARTIRWRIFAGAPDVPAVALPLASRYLDNLQTRLGQVQTQLRAAIENLKAMTAAGLPSQARSAAYAQRDVFEAQEELAARALQIVSQSGQMEGWLDGQILVHAELLDLANADSAALIQFGSHQSGSTSPNTTADPGASADPTDEQEE